MATEIERKFLVTSDAYKAEGKRSYFRQGYLNTEAERTIRVRIADEKAYLTIKGKNKGISRAEFEYEIPEADAEQMLNTLALPTIIEKYRYRIEYEGKTWEVDEFLGDNAGLVLAEIELESESESFLLPAWLGQEVSEDARYFNSMLSQNPYINWK